MSVRTILRPIAVFAVAAVLAGAPGAFAQKAGPNGGMVQGKDGHETELVLSPTEIAVYILDGGTVHSVKGVNVRAIVQESGKSTTVALTSPDGKKLVGKLAKPLGAGAIVVITGKDDHGHSISSRYVLK